MSLVAIIPVTSLLAANSTLEAANFGPSNFSVPAYTGSAPTHAALHAWPDAVFQAAVAALAGVVIAGPPEEGEPADPVSRTNALIELQGAQWGAQAPELPVGNDYPGNTHPVIAGTLYRWTDGSMWSVISDHDRAVYGGDPAQYPAIIRRVRDPNVVGPWHQPLDPFDSYRLINPFTGQAEECTKDGKTWFTTLDYNVFEPGTVGAGWADKASGVVPVPVDEWPAWVPWTSGLNADLYQVGAKVTDEGKRWIANAGNNHWKPGTYGWVEQP
jgi:hypothetical protein